MKRYLVAFLTTIAVVLCQIEFPELPTQRLDSANTAETESVFNGVCFEIATSVLVGLETAKLTDVTNSKLKQTKGRLHPHNKLDLNKRVPLYAPNKCPKNQLLYPGDQEHDWICDCGLGYIYYPAKDGCFAAYRQGPCGKGEHLIIKRGEVIPECIPNPCEDGFAISNGKCYEMGKPNGPCRPVNEGGGIFDVNATTLKVECLIGTDRLSLFNLPNWCAPGSKRDSNGLCRVVYNN